VYGLWLMVYGLWFGGSGFGLRVWGLPNNSRVGVPKPQTLYPRHHTKSGFGLRVEGLPRVGVPPGVAPPDREEAGHAPVLARILPCKSLRERAPSKSFQKLTFKSLRERAPDWARARTRPHPVV